MATIDAGGDAVDVLRSNPVLFAAGAVNALVVVPAMALSILGIPILPELLSLVSFFIGPFVLAGTIGMAHEALSGTTTFDMFTEAGKRRYLTMLIGSIIQSAIAAVFAFLAGIGGLFWVVWFFASGLGGGRVGGLLNVLTGPNIQLLPLFAIAAPILLGFLTVMFLIQFFPPAIVVENCGPIESFKRSYAVVRANLVPALGYSTIVLVIRLFSSLVYAIPSTAAVVNRVRGGTLGTEVTAAIGIALVTAVLLYPFQQAFATAFYVRHADVDATGGEGSELNPAPV